MTYKLEDCVLLVRDTVDPRKISPETPYIGLEHINEGTLSLNGFGYAKDVDSNKSKFKEGDILFGKLRPYFRKVIIAPFEGICSTDIWVIRPKKGYDRNFIFYWLASWDFVNFINQSSEGTKMPRAQWEIARNSVSPAVLNEVKIGFFLRSLDLQIDNNSKINNTLESIAQTLFKSWFVDFDPVKAKIEAKEQGKDPQLAAMMVISGKTETEINQMSADKRNELATTVDLFVDEMDQSELGEVPKGWKIGKIGDIYNTTSGGTPSREVKDFYNDGNILWVKSKELANTYVFDTEERITDLAISKSSAKMLPKGSVLLAMYGATVGQFSILGENATCNQAICAILPNNNHPYTYIYSWLKENRTTVMNRASGSAQQNISQIIIRNIELITPSKEILRLFHLKTDIIFQEIFKNLKENSNLRNLRDELLLQLMSGNLLFEEGGIK